MENLFNLREHFESPDTAEIPTASGTSIARTPCTNAATGSQARRAAAREAATGRHLLSRNLLVA